MNDTFWCYFEQNGANNNAKKIGCCSTSSEGLSQLDKGSLKNVTLVPVVNWSNEIQMKWQGPAVADLNP